MCHLALPQPFNGDDGRIERQLDELRCLLAIDHSTKHAAVDERCHLHPNQHSSPGVQSPSSAGGLRVFTRRALRLRFLWSSSCIEHLPHLDEHAWLNPVGVPLACDDVRYLRIVDVRDAGERIEDGTL